MESKSPAAIRRLSSSEMGKYTKEQLKQALKKKIRGDQDTKLMTILNELSEMKAERQMLNEWIKFNSTSARKCAM